MSPPRKACSICGAPGGHYDGCKSIRGMTPEGTDPLPHLSIDPNAPRLEQLGILAQHAVSVLDSACDDKTRLSALREARETVLAMAKLAGDYHDGAQIAVAVKVDLSEEQRACRAELERLLAT